MHRTYTFAKNFADNQGYTADHFADENSGHRTMDALNRRQEYGDVYGTRRHRWQPSAIYELPIGRGREIGSKMNRFADAIVGGWQLSSILLWQTGPYDPVLQRRRSLGTGSGVIGRDQAPDLIANPTLSNPNRNNWFNQSAYVCPATPGWQPGQACLIGTPGNGTPIGRFGNAGISTISREQ